MPATTAAKPTFLFDLDGTLIDSVYEHVLAWREALGKLQIQLSTWRIHRRVGMSDGLIFAALQRETGRKLTEAEVAQLRRLHTQAFLKRVAQVRPLPGARELLSTLSRLSVRWAIATSGTEERAREAVKVLDIHSHVELITRDDVARGKPFPDLFLAGAERLRANIGDCIVVGDSIWDMLAARRARALGVGLLCGGYGQDELVQAGAYRVYEDPAELERHVDELGVQLDD